MNARTLINKKVPLKVRNLARLKVDFSTPITIGDCGVCGDSIAMATKGMHKMPLEHSRRCIATGMCYNIT
jgi:hypothetical protein